ncbi:hypothetical protein WKW79_17415 [Variovorax robiniae]|uniref:Uncharacterized protein n=1 Tax=Variovorax robiniae TaxID=1836199 RepID=A0ABU8X9B5_9BURK
MSSDSAYKGCSFDPQKFATRGLAEEHPTSFQTYVDLRLRGISQDLALIEAFEMIRLGIDLSNISTLTLAIETNPFVRQRIDAALEAASIKTDLWSEKRAVHKLLKMVEDPSVRDGVRLQAIDRLNILCGYVVLEDDVNDRPSAGSSLKDYQRAHEEWVAAGGVAH